MLDEVPLTGRVDDPSTRAGSVCADGQGWKSQSCDARRCTTGRNIRPVDQNLWRDGESIRSVSCPQIFAQDLLNNEVGTNLDEVVVGVKHSALLEEDRIGAFRVPFEMQGDRIQPRVQIAVEICDKFLLVFRVFGFFSTHRFVDSILQGYGSQLP